MLLSRSHSSFPYHADPDVMQSYASQYPAMLSCNKHFQFSFNKLSGKEKIMFPLLGDFMPLMTLFNGQVSGYSLFKSGQRKFGEGTYLDKNVTVLESSYCLYCRRLHPDGLGREPEVRVRQGEEQQREGCYLSNYRSLDIRYLKITSFAFCTLLCRLSWWRTTIPGAMSLTSITSTWCSQAPPTLTTRSMQSYCKVATFIQSLIQMISENPLTS